MAQWSGALRGDFDEILTELEGTVMHGSVSASLEGEDDWEVAGARCAVRVYERYSWAGGNRLSLSLTLMGTQEESFLSAITAGGSQAVFWKVNTWGEGSFLDTIRDVIEKYRK